jgi:enamine deaminase RidA (YjgF/YER057c/UK114 family)
LIFADTDGGDMRTNTRRTFFGRIAALLAAIASAPRLFAQPSAAQKPENAPTDVKGTHRGAHHIHKGIYYISGTGANDGYGKEDHVLVTDPFEKHVTRTMDALKRSIERAGSTMDDIIHLQVFICLPLANGLAAPAGAARFNAYKTQYETLNKIYTTYFSQGKAPSRACMAVEWIPGDSLVEIVGSAAVVNPPSAPAGL